MEKIIMKFGGSSVGSVARIENVLNIIQESASKHELKALVFSAFGETTDLLIELGEQAAFGDADYRASLKELSRFHFGILDYFVSDAGCKVIAQRKITENFEVLGELLNSIYLSRDFNPRFRDLILSFGERNSNRILAEALKSRGINCAYADARKMIKTNNRFGGARVLEEITQQKINAHFRERNMTQVVTGFISSTIDEISTSLGRGGSDYTASLLGSALEVDRIEIWSDVNGVMTANPNIVKEARNLKELNYMEAMELSHFGAKVLYPPTIIPAQKTGTSILIKNSLRPEDSGTWIIAEKKLAQDEDISGITSIPGLSILTLEGGTGRGIHGLAGRLFGCLSEEDLDIYLVTQGSSELSISFAILASEEARVGDLISKEFNKELREMEQFRLTSESNMCAIAIVGEKILFKPGIIGRAFHTLGQLAINIEAIAHGSSERNIAFLVHEKDQDRSINALHSEFFK